jgi:hypothetical protein
MGCILCACSSSSSVRSQPNLPTQNASASSTTESVAALTHAADLFDKCVNARLAALGPPPHGQIADWGAFNGEIIVEVQTSAPQGIVDYHTGIFIAKCPGQQDAGQLLINPASIKPVW